MLQEAPARAGASFETPLTRLLRMRAERDPGDPEGRVEGRSRRLRFRTLVAGGKGG